MPLPFQKLIRIQGRYVVCRLDPKEPTPEWPCGEFISIIRTTEELSIVCPEGCVPEGIKREVGFCCLQIQGPLDFGLVGILASLLGPLAEAGVSVFAMSTFDTDYLLLRDHDLETAMKILQRSGWVIT